MFLYLLIFLYILLCATYASYKLPLIDSAGTAERCPILTFACCVFHMRQIVLIVNLTMQTFDSSTTVVIHLVIHYRYMYAESQYEEGVLGDALH